MFEFATIHTRHELDMWKSVERAKDKLQLWRVTVGLKRGLVCIIIHETSLSRDQTWVQSNLTVFCQSFFLLINPLTHSTGQIELHRCQIIATSWAWNCNAWPLTHTCRVRIQRPDRYTFSLICHVTSRPVASVVFKVHPVQGTFVRQDLGRPNLHPLTETISPKPPDFDVTGRH